eukprot:TRINITY_DN134_c0_g1_i1.p2 TRINITY_DN134_c0_g1~~TRINITY_DN134_c0_g1_i1.p2  ORF type:complete len:203 (+),score=76.20 TRINITY_DN134_c0_g1_i1:109-717(+)
MRPTDFSTIKNYSLILLEQAQLTGGPTADALRQTVNSRLQSLHHYFLSLTNQKEDDGENSSAAGAASPTAPPSESSPQKKIEYLNGLLNLSSAVVSQATNKLKTNAWLGESNKLFEQVKVVLKDLESVIKDNYNYYGFCSYQVAVLFAQLGKEDSCKEWLLTAQRNQVLPPRELIENDTLLQVYHDREWFKTFLAGLEERKE